MDDTLTLIELCERNEEEGWMTSLGNWVESRTLDVLGEFRYRWLLPGLAQQQSADVLVQFAEALLGFLCHHQAAPTLTQDDSPRKTRSVQHLP